MRVLVAGRMENGQVKDILKDHLIEMTDLVFFVNKSIIYTLKNVCRQNWKK